MPQYTRLSVDWTAVIRSGYQGNPGRALNIVPVLIEVHLSSVTTERDTVNPGNVGYSIRISRSRKVTVATVHSFDSRNAE